MQHCRALLNAGYDRYVPINRFDVARAADPYEKALASSRYSYRPADVGVGVVFAKRNDLVEAYGRAIEVGDIGAVLIFEDEQVAAGLERLRPHTGGHVTIRFLSVNRSVTGTIIEADLSTRPTTIEVEYSSLTSISSRISTIRAFGVTTV